MYKKIRIVGLDLDGTVLDNRKRIHGAVREAITAASRAGILVLPVTGRPFHGLPEELMTMPAITCAICSNGAVTYRRDRKEDEFGPGGPHHLRMDSPETGSGESEAGFFCDNLHPLSGAMAAYIVSLARKTGALYTVFADGYGYAEQECYERLLHQYEGGVLYPYFLQSRRPVADIDAFLRGNDRVENVWITTGSREEADRIEETIQAAGPVTTLRTLPEDVECVAPEADKGRALLSLAGHLGISQEEIMAVGDSDNDLGLLKMAGTAVAMGNATGRVRELADVVVADNEHDGVAEALRMAMG